MTLCRILGLVSYFIELIEFFGFLTIESIDIETWIKYCRKIHELSNIGFPMKQFTTDFSQFCWTTVEICHLGGG